MRYIPGVSISTKGDYSRLKDIHGNRFYIPNIKTAGQHRKHLRRGFSRARDALTYRERVLSRYERLRQALQ